MFLATITAHHQIATSVNLLHQCCPICGTTKPKVATPETFSDKLLSRLTIYPFRCQLCAAPFRTFVGRRINKPRRSFERVQVTFPVWFKLRQSLPLPWERRGARQDERRLRQAMDLWLPDNARPLLEQ